MFKKEINNTIRKKNTYMNYNYQKARELMIENQLRPNKIKDPMILDIFKNLPKEDFLPEKLGIFSYADKDIKLSKNRGYLKNLHIAQLIKHSDIDRDHKVLHIGALTGYVSSLLSKLCHEIFVIEISSEYKISLEENIVKCKIDNLKIVDGTFKEGFKIKAPYDRIIIDTPIKNIDNSILDQLNENSGKLIMIKKDYSHLSKAIKITKNGKNLNQEYLFDVFSNYELYEEKEGFKF